jgi:hypothetical protein
MPMCTNVRAPDGGTWRCMVVGRERWQRSLWIAHSAVDVRVLHCLRASRERSRSCALARRHRSHPRARAPGKPFGSARCSCEPIGALALCTAPVRAAVRSPRCTSGCRRSGAHARRAPRAGAMTARNVVSVRLRRAGGARAQAARRASPRPRPKRIDDAPGASTTSARTANTERQAGWSSRRGSHARDRTRSRQGEP